MTTKERKLVRASDADLAAACPASVYGEQDTVAINRDDDASIFGTATHELCALIAQEKRADVKRVALKYNFDRNDTRQLEIMASIAVAFWLRYKEQFAWERIVEHEMTGEGYGLRFSGHVDVSGINRDRVLTALDWKTTRLEDADYIYQMLLYLWLLSTLERSADMRPLRYRFVICFLRDKTIQTSDDYTEEELRRWGSSFASQILNWDKRTYNPGRRCHYCPRYGCCPGRREMVRSEIATLCSGDGIYRTINEISAAKCVEAYERLRMMEGFIKDAIGEIKARTEREGGALQGDGRALMMKEKKNTTIHGQLAWPILTQYLTEDELAPAVTISKTMIDDAVAAKAPRGQKKKSKEQVLQKLRDAGAIDEKPVRYPAIIKALPITETETDDG